MRAVALPAAFSGLLATAVLAGGCFDQGKEGDSCKLTPDCAGGLVCDNPGGESGVCRKPGDVPVRLDAAPVDASRREAGADARGDGGRDALPDGGAERPAPDAGDGGPAGDGPGDGAVDAPAGDGGTDGGDARIDAPVDASAG
jgi:hypothetical protein